MGERWQTLQAHLASARALAQAGDVPAALQAIDTALDIDPQFLAAHSLKERLTQGTAVAAAEAPLEKTPPSEEPSAPRVLSAISAIEAKALSRRAARRLNAAREAIHRRDFTTAAAAMDEARELGADAADVLGVESALAEARAGRSRRISVGRWLVGAATVVAGIFGAQYVDDRFAGSIPEPAIVEPAAAPAPAAAPSAIAPTGISEPAVTREETIRLAPDEPRDVTPPSAPAPLPTPQHPTSRAPVASTAPVGPIGPLELPARVAPPVTQRGPVEPLEGSAQPVARSMPAAPPVAQSPPVTRPVADPIAAPRTDADESGIRDVLQRYRTAYEQLNAQSARAVWPAVDEHALARAFDGLEAQRLDFDSCDVNLRGDSATATCRGTARYTPKIGSREPQVEPRTWSFTLRRDQGQWAIETARVVR